MTQAETSRGRGRPKSFDEDELLERVRSIDDLERVRDALEANGEGLLARYAFGWLLAKYRGDSTGGGVARSSEFRYRAALARLPHDPLRPKGRSARIAGRSQRGQAHLAMVSVGAGVGSLALAAISNPQTALALARCLAPIMPRTPQELTELDLAA